MMLINVFLTLVLTIKCLSDRICINEVLLIENNYFGENGTKIKTDEGYLKSISVKLINDGKEYFDDSCQLSKRLYNDMKKRSYSVLSPLITKYILSTFNSTKKGMLKFHYIFTNSKCRFKKVFNTIQRKERYYDSYKVLIKNKRDTIAFEDDGIDAYLSHIKLVLTEIINSGFITLEDIDSILKDNDSMEQILKFKLHFFETHSFCLSNFKNFLNFLNFLKLEEDNKILFLQKSSIKTTNNKFKASTLNEFLKNKFYNEYAKKTADVKILNSYEQIKHLFEECRAELAENLLSNKIILPFKSSFTLDFYLDKFYGFIKKVIEDMIQDINQDRSNSKKNYYDYQKDFLNQVTDMFKEIIDNAWESLNVIEYFSNFFDREIKTVEDFVEIDKLLCDYYNMIICIRMIKNNLDYSKLILLNPMLIDDYQCRLIRALELRLESQNKWKEIKVYDSTGKKLHIRKNVDFYVNMWENDNITITFEKIRERKIHDIEIILKNGEISEKIYVGKFLDNFNKE